MCASKLVHVYTPDIWRQELFESGQLDEELPDGNEDCDEADTETNDDREALIQARALSVCQDLVYIKSGSKMDSKAYWTCQYTTLSHTL